MKIRKEGWDRHAPQIVANYYIKINLHAVILIRNDSFVSKCRIACSYFN